MVSCDEFPEEAEIHELFDGKIRIFQKQNGYRFSIDTVLLGIFAMQRAGGAVADLGAGCGILPVILARSTKVGDITAIEIQDELAQLARRSCSLNNLSNRVRVLCADIRNPKDHFAPGTFDTVVTNPPFYPVGSGKINPGQQNAIARHELYGTIEDFMRCASYLLKNGGRLLAVFKSARTVDLFVHMRSLHIEPKTAQYVHSRKVEPAGMILVEAVKGAGAEIRIQPPLVLYDRHGRYTEQALSLFQSL